MHKLPTYPPAACRVHERGQEFSRFLFRHFNGLPKEVRVRVCVCVV